MIINGRAVDVAALAVMWLAIAALSGWALLGTFAVPRWRRSDRARRDRRIVRTLAALDDFGRPS